LSERDGNRVDDGRNRGTERPVARYRVAAGKERRRCRPRGRSLTVDDDHAAIARRVDDDGRFATEPKVRDFDDRGGENGGDTRIDRVSARGQHAATRLDRERAASSDDAA
jgi:hypothetical protein